MIGPLYLHWDGSYETYHPFFAHIQRKIEDDILAADIRIGSDDEKALVKAMESLFPNATRYLCTKHLKDNISRYLQDKVGANTTDRNNIMSDIFGPQGLVTADDTFTFEQKARNICSNSHQYPKFVE